MHAHSSFIKRSQAVRHITEDSAFCYPQVTFPTVKSNLKCLIIDIWMFVSGDSKLLNMAYLSIYPKLDLQKSL